MNSKCSNIVPFQTDDIFWAIKMCEITKNDLLFISISLFRDSKIKSCHLGPRHCVAATHQCIHTAHFGLLPFLISDILMIAMNVQPISLRQ